MSHDRQEIISILADLPISEKLAHLVFSLIVDDKPAVSTEVLIETALVMAQHLPEAERARVVWHLNAAAEEIKARWN
jgi:hypothetical protein